MLKDEAFLYQISQGGSGCFVNLGGASRWKLTIDIPSQYYALISICISSERGV